MKRGASDFLTKPFERDDLLRIVEKVRALQRRSVPPSSGTGDFGLLGASTAMVQLRHVIARAARTQATVLIRGETGTGKELVARSIHRASTRAEGPLVAVHCGALPDQLLESELFGYEKGAFTGAVSSKPGRVALAEGGTLFLDEVGDVSPAVQVKLLRLLQEKEYEVLGGTKLRRADVRFIAATHRALETDMMNGSFREDLFYRLNVIPIRVPALRERTGDVPELAEHFRASACREHGCNIRFAQSALEELARHPWPGNVRELANVVERVIVLADSDVIEGKEIRSELLRAAPSTSGTPRGTKGVIDKQELIRALQRSGNNRALAARLLGVSRRTLYNWIAAHGLDAHGTIDP